jgi:hypothetical protein
MSRTRLTRILGPAMAAALLCGCATSRGVSQPAQPPAPPGETEFSLFLIGDAGHPAEGEPVLRALTTAMTPAAARSAVVFLGDNIYPQGLPPAGDPNRREMERRLLDQIAAVPSPARGLFVPGNHDWERSGPGGLTSIRAQQGLVEAHSGNPVRISLSPADGCPGPVAIDDLNPRLRLVALDTQWWLHGHEKGGTSCQESNETQVLAALDAVLASAGARHVVLVAHHPMLSSGSHGGHYNWQDHLFPLTRVAKALWIPMPGIGSLYPLFRITVPSAQDISSGENRRMRGQIAQVLRKHRPLVYAGGHEHTQEVLKGDSARFFLVSGAGIHGHVTPTRRRTQTLFRKAASGFMRMDLQRDGRVRLLVFHVDAKGVAYEAWSELLE